MARGKNANKAANRRRKALEQSIAELTAELKAEEKSLGAAEAALEKTQQLKSEIRTEILDTQADTSGYARSLRDELEYLQSTLIDYAECVDRFQDFGQKYTGRCIDLSPGATGTERIEYWMSVLGVEGFIVDDRPGQSANMSTEEAIRLQALRGGRSRESGTQSIKTDSVISAALLRHELRETLGLTEDHRWFHIDPESDAFGDIPADASQEVLHLLASKDSHRSPAELHAWGTGPLMNHASLTGALPRMLGHSHRRPDGSSFSAAGAVLATGSRTTAAPVADQRTEIAARLFDQDQKSRQAEPEPEYPAAALTPSMTADDRKSVADQRPEGVFRGWKATFDSRQLLAEKMGYSARATSAVPRHPRPSYGAVSQHIYARSAFAGWLHHGPGADRMAEVAVGMTAAATYWLPAGQTAAFADSEPPSQDEIDAMTLPFSQIFVAFADPVAIDAYQDADDPVVREISGAIHRVQTKNFDLRHVENARASLIGLEEDPIFSISDIAAVTGAQIEGLLLLGDELNQPEDVFAWCLRIPDQYGTSLARITVPALRSKTAHRQLVDNITAVTAWAHWHQPSSEDVEVVNHPGAENREALRRLEREGAGVHIVDTGRTKARAPKDAAASNGETRNVAPHVRRAHWRRQRYGSGRVNTRMVHIPATVVNIHRGNLAHQVYTLPAAS